MADDNFDFDDDSIDDDDALDYIILEEMDQEMERDRADQAGCFSILLFFLFPAGGFVLFLKEFLLS